MNEFSVNPIPWYRTRKFWAVVYGLMLLWSIFFYFWLLHGMVNSFAEFISSIIFTLGGSVLMVLGSEFFGNIGSYVGSAIYISVALYLIRKTFTEKLVELRYPFIFIVIYVIGVITNFVLLSAFA